MDEDFDYDLNLMSEDEDLSEKEGSGKDKASKKQSGEKVGKAKTGSRDDEAMVCSEEDDPTVGISCDRLYSHWAHWYMYITSNYMTCELIIYSRTCLGRLSHLP